MAKYRVWVKSIDYVYVDVEADNEDKAREIAEGIDGGQFVYTDRGDWVLDSVDEINDNGDYV